MKCPKCGTEEGIVYFLRHQKQENEKDDTDANCITILCQSCGENQSFMIEDLIVEIFSDWSGYNSSPIDFSGLSEELPDDLPVDLDEISKIIKTTI